LAIRHTIKGAGTNLKVAAHVRHRAPKTKCACVGVGLFDAADISVLSEFVSLTVFAPVLKSSL